MIAKIIKNNLLLMLFFAAFFLYIWLQINPALYYQQQEPVFLLSNNFFSGFMSRPGGLTEYLSAFLAQLYIFPFAGSIVITFIVLLICISAKTIIKLVNKNSDIRFLHLLPSVILLYMYNDYRYYLAWSLGLLISLLFICLYLKIVPKKLVLKISIYVLAGIILYYLTAGQFLFYFLVCLCIEIISDVTRREKIIFLLFSIIPIAIIPYIAYIVSPVMTLRESYLGILPFEADYPVLIVSCLLYLYVPLIVIVFGIRKYYFTASSVEETRGKVIIEKETKGKEIKGKETKGKKNQVKKTKTFENKFATFFTGKTKFAFQIIALIVLTILASYFSFNEKKKNTLLVDYYAQNERWEDVLKVAQKQKLISLKSIYQTNRALVHLGQLSSSMFSYPQTYGSQGIVPSGDFMTANTSLMSDVFFELGFLNPSLHWASDALTHSGETRQNLKRLFLINLLSGNKHFAQNCLNILSETMFSRNLTDDYQKYLNDDKLLRLNDNFSKILSCNIDSNYVFQSDNMIVEFKSLLKKNLNNKIAFEYLMAYYLLNCNLGNFVNYLVFLRNFGYTELPRHYEEALLIFKAMTGINKDITPGFTLNPSTLQRFSEFRKVLANYKGDLSLAKNELMEKFGDTYWYYMVYHPAFRKSMNKHS